MTVMAERRAAQGAAIWSTLGREDAKRMRLAPGARPFSQNTRRHGAQNGGPEVVSEQAHGQ